MREGNLVKKLVELVEVDEQEAEELKRKIPDMGDLKIKVKEKPITAVNVIDKGELFTVMQYLKEKYYKNNEISTQLVKIIPNLDMITIDVKRCKCMEIPQISCKEKTGAVKIIPVRRTHKIIWSLLNECGKY